MSRQTIHERVRDCGRDVAEAFGVPVARVDAVVEKLKRQALELAFGDDPRAPIAEELAQELRAEVEGGMEKLLGRPGESPVIDFPAELRPTRRAKVS